MSSYVEAALRLKLQQDRLGGLIRDLEAEFGEVPEQIMEDVRREWPVESDAGVSVPASAPPAA